MKFTTIINAVIFLSIVIFAIGYSYNNEVQASQEKSAARAYGITAISQDLAGAVTGDNSPNIPAANESHNPGNHIEENWSLLFVLLLATFIGLGVILRVSRLLHTPLMSLTNAISAIAVIGSITVAGEDYPSGIRLLGAIALFASMTNIVSGFLITDRMLKMFKQKRGEGR